MHPIEDSHFKARRINLTTSFAIDAPPAVVFPLLCPVREREWIEGWSANIVYSESGVVENHCVFATVNRLLGEAIYVTTRHEPDAGIVEFVIFYGTRCVQKLDIAVSATPEGGSRLRWSHTYTGLNTLGNAALDVVTEHDFADRMSVLARSLERYVRRTRG
jgi:hypothetical protein